MNSVELILRFVVNWLGMIEDTVTTFWIQTWLPDFILGITPFRIFVTWPVKAEVTHYLQTKTVISSLSIDRQLNIRNNARPKLGIHAKKCYKRLGLRPQITQSFHCRESVLTVPTRQQGLFIWLPLVDDITFPWCKLRRHYIHGWGQDCCNSNVSAVELPQSCTKPSI